MSTLKNQFHPQIAFHPGETLGEKLGELGMGPKEFALRTGKPEKTIIAVLTGKSSITPEMAVQFEHVLKIPAHFWLNVQRSYDEYLARVERMEILAESVAWAKQFPVTDMVKKGWIPAKSTIEEKTSVLLDFFGFSNHTSWENYYFNQQLKVKFRISLNQTKDPYSISAWLRRGEIQAAELPSNTFNEKQFRAILPDLKSLMANHPDDFFNQLQEICLGAGVKVVHTPCINKAPINGSTRWLNDNPLIQLTGRYKRNDIFWFTFFHEAGHILLHGKKDIFLENIEYSEKDMEKEHEADEFAIKWTLSKSEQAELLEKSVLSTQDITQFAVKFNTHPAIIIGRLQHEGLVPHSLGRQFFIPIELN